MFQEGISADARQRLHQLLFQPSRFGNPDCRTPDSHAWLIAALLPRADGVTLRTSPHPRSFPAAASAGLRRLALGVGQVAELLRGGDGRDTGHGTRCDRGTAVLGAGGEHTRCDRGPSVRGGGHGTRCDRGPSVPPSGPLRKGVREAEGGLASLRPPPPPAKGGRC